MCLRIKPHTPHPLSPVHIKTCPRSSACSAEENTRLRTENAAQAFEIKELKLVNDKMLKLKVKSAECVGVWKSKDKNTLRKVYKGPKNGIYMLTPSKVTITKTSDWEPLDESEVDERIAAHEAWKQASPTK